MPTKWHVPHTPVFKKRFWWYSIYAITNWYQYNEPNILLQLTVMDKQTHNENFLNTILQIRTTDAAHSSL
jgi:hypothetical protein